MKKSIKIYMILIIPLLVYGISYAEPQANTNIDTTTSTHDYSKLISLLTASQPINIYSDTDFVLFGLPGNGSIVDPYRIENLLIENPIGFGIYISGVSKHFIIQNCVIRNAQTEGMIINNIKFGNGKLLNNIVENSVNVGILVLESKGIVLENNICFENAIGIEQRFSTDCYFFNNTCDSNINDGMYLRSKIQGSTFENNTLINNGVYGMNFFFANGSFVYNNTFVNNGMRILENDLETYLFYDVKGNVVNNQKIGHFKNLESIILSVTEYGQIFLYNCSNVLIENQSFVDALTGIIAYESTNCTFYNNDFVNNLEHGIDVFNSTEIIVDSNIFNNNSDGLNFYDSPNMTIINNEFYNDGLVIQNTAVDILSTYVVQNNTVNDKLLGYFMNEHNIVLSNIPHYGQILVVNSTNIEIHDQEITNSRIGIILLYSNSCSIYNTLFSNLIVGIMQYGCDNITIQGNTFEYNFDCYLSWYVTNMVFRDNILSLNFDDGIELLYSDFINIENNVFEYFDEWAILIRYSSRINLTSNLINHNVGGNVYIEFSDNIMIYDTTSSNSYYGLFLAAVSDSLILESKIEHNQGDGISLINCQNIGVTSNNITDNFNGIKLRFSDYSEISYNTIRLNFEYGIYIDSHCEGHVIHHNYFIENQVNDLTGLISQCWDDGQNNVWYDLASQEGNWWSNIRGYAYRIGGYAVSVDIYPLNPEIITQTTPTTTTETAFPVLFPLLFFLGVLFSFVIKKRRKS